MATKIDPGKLAPPPRRLPPSALAVALFGPGHVAGAWFLLAVGAVPFWLFAANADLSGWRFRGPLEQARGVAVASYGTRFYENEEDEVHATEYAFTAADGTRREGTSYRSDFSPPRDGESVVVEHPPGNPAVSRLRGMRRAPLGPRAAVASIFALLPAIAVAVFLRTGLRAARLAVRGEWALAALKSSERVLVDADDQVHAHRLTFEFRADDGRMYTFVEHAWVPGADRPAGKLVLYDPRDPEGARVFDALPGGFRMEQDGTIRPAPLGAAAAALALPALVVAGNLAWAAYR